MSKTFQIMLVKDVAYIRTTETIIRKLEIDGWHTVRDVSNDMIVLTTRSSFGTRDRLISHLRGILTTSEQSRIKIVDIQ